MTLRKREHCIACGKEWYPGHKCSETFEARQRMRERMEEAKQDAEPERTFSDRLDEAQAMRGDDGV